ncbi:MAG: nitrate/nitrite transporter NrtS [Pseudomonadota bacterium]
MSLLVKPVTVKRALKVGLVVGTILIGINQGDLIAAGQWPPVWKIALTYLVPYSVSSYSTAALLSDLDKR